MEVANEVKVNPSKIMQIGIGFWASKTLLSAVNMSLFTYLGEGSMTGESIQAKLGLHKRGLYDFLDTLVALGFLEREGIKDTSVYQNTAETSFFLDKNKPSYMGGMLEMSNNRLYPFWDSLEEGLKTGMPQNETKTGGAPLFEAIYANEERLREFLKAMGGIQMGNFMALAQKFDFSPYSTHCDLGGAGGYLSTQIAMHNPNMNCISFDLPPVEPVASENIKMMGLSSRVETQAGDFFNGDIPKVDVITMGNILHDWGVVDKKKLIKKAYDALPKGGALIIVENVIDDNRSENAFGLMMSLNMLIETPEGFDFSASDFSEWANEVGFTNISVTPLTGPTSAIIAIK